MLPRISPFPLLPATDSRAILTKLVPDSRAGLLLLGFLVILIGVQALSAFAIVSLGPFTVDEVVYHLMVKNLAEGNGLTIANGYHEMPSDEFGLMFVRPAGERLVAQYPYLYAFLAAPLYPLFGFNALFYLNSFAFVGGVVLMRRITRQFGWNESVALAAVLVYVFGTYAWEYSIAAWPHSISVFLLLGAFSLFLTALNETDSRRATIYAALAGLVLGCGVGLRLDTIVTLPAFLVPHLFSNPPRWRQAAALAMGLLPALSLMAVTNALRWDVFSPFSYGAQGDATLDGYLRLAGIALAISALIWIGTRACVRQYLRNYPVGWVLGIVAVLLLLLVAFVPSQGAIIARILKGLYILGVDLGQLPLSRVEPGMSRSIFDSVVYSGTIKKALLQSCPYMVFILIPIVSSRYQRELRQPMLLALAIPLLMLLFYAPFSWHGGKAFNLRYFLPALPFLSLLIGWAIIALAKGLKKPHIEFVILSASLVAIIHLVSRRVIDVPIKLDLEGNIDFFYGTIPNILIALFLALVLVWVRKSESRMNRTMVLTGLISGIVWSGLVAYTYDTPRTLDIRASRLWLAETTARYVEDGALMLVDSASHLYTLISFRPDVRIATPANDDFSDTSKLIDFSLSHGRSAYGILSPKSWETFFEKIPSSIVKTTIVTYLDPYIVRRIERR